MKYEMNMSGGFFQRSQYLSTIFSAGSYLSGALAGEISFSSGFIGRSIYLWF